MKIWYFDFCCFVDYRRNTSTILIIDFVFWLIGRNVAVVVVSCPARLFVSRGHIIELCASTTLFVGMKMYNSSLSLNAADLVSRRQLWFRKKILKTHHVVKKYLVFTFLCIYYLKKKNVFIISPSLTISLSEFTPTVNCNYII